MILEAHDHASVVLSRGIGRHRVGDPHPSRGLAIRIADLAQAIPDAHAVGLE
jgi:hypothetical protein